MTLRRQRSERRSLWGNQQDRASFISWIRSVESGSDRYRVLYLLGVDERWTGGRLRNWIERVKSFSWVTHMRGEGH
jgi:hypothetical protein